MRFGLRRRLIPEGRYDSLHSEHNATWLHADSCIPSQFDAILAEGAASEASGQETLGTGPFGDLPVLTIRGSVPRSRTRA